MKKYYLILLLILILPFALAEDFNLKYNQPITYKGLQIKLLSVGSSGTIRLWINGQEKYIEKNKEIIFYDVKFKNLEQSLQYQSAKVSMELQAECLIDEDCKESNPCSISVCNYRTCEFSKTLPGCSFNSECKSIGSFEEVNNKLSYCSEDNTWRPRKSYKESCQYNYECLSNLCDNNKCDKPLFGKNKKMAPAWILIIIGGLMLAESLFILFKTNFAKKIIKNASFWRENTWKTIAIIELIIALALIIWALL